MSSWLVRANGVCTHGLHAVIAQPVIRSVLIVVYFSIAEYIVQFTDAHSVMHPGNSNLYFRLF